MIRTAFKWCGEQLRDLALSALGIREEVRLVRRVSAELEEWRTARDEDHSLDAIFPRIEESVDVEAATDVAWPVPVALADVDCVEAGLVTRATKLSRDVQFVQVAGEPPGYLPAAFVREEVVDDNSPTARFSAMVWP